MRTDDQAEALTREGGLPVTLGEELEACQPAGVLAEIEAKHGRPCPRIVLLPGNVVPWQLFQLIIRDDARAMFTPLFEALTASYDRDGRAGLIRRVLGTLNDSEVHGIMHPEPKR